MVCVTASGKWTLVGKVPIGETGGFEDGVQDVSQCHHCIALSDYQDWPKDRVSSLIVESLAGCALPRVKDIAVSSALLEGIL